MAHSRVLVWGRAPRRSVLWSEGPRNTSIQALTAVGASAWNLGQSSGGGVTIMRIRGTFTAWLDLVTAIGDGFINVAAGIGIVSGDAFAAGAGSMPSPLSDPDWDWLWINYFGAVVGSTVTEEFKGLAAVRAVVDTKAMRKIAPNETVFGMTEVDTEVGTSSLSYSVMTRMLFKLG